VSERDEDGHEWGETFMRDRFPLVCIRCMLRSDSPQAERPCDAAAERVRERP